MNKPLSYTTIALLFLSLMSCTDEMCDNVSKESVITEITAIIDGSPTTKTCIVDNGNGGKNVVWKKGNSVSLFFGNGTGGGSKFTTTDNGPIAAFSGTISAISGSLSGLGGNSYFWATYPYNATASCDGNSITTVLESYQYAYPNDVANDLLVTVGRSVNPSIYFRNTYTLIEFTLSQENISRITFRGNNKERVAGQFIASMDENNVVTSTPTENAVRSIVITPGSTTTFATGTKYYFAFLPGTFSNGYTLTFRKTDGTEATYTRSTAFTFAIGTFYTMYNKDGGLEFTLPQNVAFSDANFEAYCVANFDIDDDGEISFSEALSVTEISVNTDNIESLTGIEYFTNLVRLDCCGSMEFDSSLKENVIKGKLKTLDVSKNTRLTELVCRYNQLTSLDVSNCTALTKLVLTCNHLTNIDVSNSTALTGLFCAGNQLTSLDVSNCTVLTELYCGNNQLTSIDVSKNTALTRLSCGKNQLASIDVSKNTALNYLECCNNQLTSIDVSKNIALQILYCYNNPLTSLDVSKNTALTHLYCYNNQLTSLDVSKNTALKELRCYDNQLTSIDVSKNTALTHLDCSDNQLTSIDVSKNTALNYLECCNNQLTSLDVSKNTALKELRCYDNQLTSLDVSKNTALTLLHCGNNQLTSIDVSKNTALKELRCYDNQLTSLDVSNNTSLSTLWCFSNPHLREIWFKNGQSLTGFEYDGYLATIKFK